VSWFETSFQFSGAQKTGQRSFLLEGPLAGFGNLFKSLAQHTQTAHRPTVPPSGEQAVIVIIAIQALVHPNSNLNLRINIRGGKGKSLPIGDYVCWLTCRYLSFDFLIGAMDFPAAPPDVRRRLCLAVSGLVIHGLRPWFALCALDHLKEASYLGVVKSRGAEPEPRAQPMNNVPARPNKTPAPTTTEEPPVRSRGSNSLPGFLVERT